MIVEPDVVEADLAAGRLLCPACDSPLTRWGYARERQVRTRNEIRSITPRRAFCQPCETTHVLLPAWAVPRRRDSAEVIGAALVPNATRDGASEDRGAAPATTSDSPWMAAHVRPPRRAGHREREALDARDQPERVGSHPSVRRACRRRRRRARRHDAHVSPAVRDVGITVGAGRLHRPACSTGGRATRPGSEPASCGCYA